MAHNILVNQIHQYTHGIRASQQDILKNFINNILK